MEPAPSPERARLSWGCVAFQRTDRSTLAPVWVRRSLHVLAPQSWTSRSSRAWLLGAFVKTSPRPSPRLALPFRGRPNIKPLSASAPEARWQDSPSHGVSCPYSVCSRREAACVVGIASTRPPTPSGFLNLLALHRPALAGLVSCRLRSWGSPFRALFLSCSRSPSPAPLPS